MKLTRPIRTPLLTISTALALTASVALAAQGLLLGRIQAIPVAYTDAVRSDPATGVSYFTSGSTLFAYDLASWTPKWRVKLSDESYGAFDNSRDGKFVAVREGSTLALLNPKDGTRLRSFNVSTSYEGVRFSPDGKTLIVFGDGGVNVVDLKTGSIREIGDCTQADANSLEYSRDGRLVLAASCMSGVQVIDVASGKVVKEFETQKYVTSISKSGDSGAFLVTGTEGAFYLLPGSLDSVKTFTTDAADDTLSSALNADGNLAVLSDYGFLYLVDFKKQTLKGLQYMKEVSGQTSDLSFSRDGQTILVGHHDGISRFSIRDFR
ncbi:DNA-binding beta-propeller fold protein YncE [Deinococcus metalli]|uniref:DNA-binding beta-propeller fold protein YncE n=1 Tax=Deinococcus metalli TaxID=1141878 RepID=A0A7W8KIA7_9DEIO|nr:PQQ-binding-like beta-propeller repeat protein [Deinococcus metalli]MBB5377551.1 DNA-binding beta-propeller fold protein YncE [Deinococcus metalli]GHF51306.1 hypothetical protein GCM10017781_29800 [Deinococcus metalli]